MVRQAENVSVRPSVQRQAVEVPVFIRSRNEHLGAIVTVPEDATSDIGVILMCGRARDRAHRNGMWVRAAAELARRGMYALRLDYPGVGNSTGHPQVFGLEDPPVWAVSDAVRFLVDQTPVRRVLLVATCYGGRLVIQAAPSIDEVVGVAVIAAPAYARTPSLVRRVLERGWRMLRRGKGESVPSNAIRQRREQNLAIDHRVSPALAKALRQFVRRGTVYFLYGEDDFVYEEISFALGRLRLPRDRYELDVVPGDLHVFNTVEVQSLTIDRVVRWCAGVADMAGKASPP
jgi:pimeloyl-ACP methyl ester carboxylesterase